MIVNSFDFLWLFPLIFLTYLCVNNIRKGHTTRLSNYFLLVVSYLLFWHYNQTLTLALFGVTAVTYAGARAVHSLGRRRTIIITTILLALIPLIALKYYNFINENLTLLFARIGIDSALPGMNWAIPLGISFFSLQAIGYFHDVATQKIEAEKNFADYMLFVSFFPQIAAGPISKASDLLPQIKRQRIFSEAQAIQGLKWVLWGMFMKVVVADHINLCINSPLMHSELYSSPTVAAAVLFYSVQIYCDFAGYSFMALGIGQLLGFELINNFNRPYFATSVTEFWHRWHRSLSIWLKEHIYFPLGGNRCSKARNYCNILATFLVSGLWHGANWNFILWGGMHGTAQIAEKHLGLHKAPSRMLIKSLRIVLTFFLVTIAWVFFVHSDVDSALTTLKSVFYSPGKKTVDLTTVIVLTAIVLFKDIADETECRPLRLLHSRFTLVRWATYSALIYAIMVYAVYGEKFIYAGF